MITFKQKFHIAIKPFLLVMAGFIIVYSFLHWLLYLRSYLIPVKEIVFNFWIPLVIVWIPVWLWIRPALKKLPFKRSDSPVFRFSFIAGIFISMSTSIAQLLLSTATGKLTTISNVYEFASSPVTKYYKLHKYYVDKHHKGISYYTKVSGKRNHNFNMYTLIAMPIFEVPEDTLVQKRSNYWAIQEYEKTISNKKTVEEKERLFDIFKKDCWAKFDTTHFDKLSYLEHVGNIDLLDAYERASYSSNIEVPRRPIMFRAKTTPFSRRNDSAIMLFVCVLVLLAGIWSLSIIFTKLKEDI